MSNKTSESSTTTSEAPRYTVRMHQYISKGQDINGVCRRIRDSLERGIIPTIEIDQTDHGLEITNGN